MVHPGEGGDLFCGGQELADGAGDGGIGIRGFPDHGGSAVVVIARGAITPAGHVELLRFTQRRAARRGLRTAQLQP